MSLVLAGAAPAQVDRVYTTFRMPMVPFQMTGLARVDIGGHHYVYSIDSHRVARSSRGLWGQKTEAVYYDYDDHRTPSPSPLVASIIDDFRWQDGIIRREIADDEIVVRTLYTMINECADILAESIAQRASDIDIVWAYGYGRPRHTGKLMFWADQILSPRWRSRPDAGRGFPGRASPRPARRRGAQA